VVAGVVVVVVAWFVVAGVVAAVVAAVVAWFVVAGAVARAVAWLVVAGVAAVLVAACCHAADYRRCLALRSAHYRPELHVAPAA